MPAQSIFENPKKLTEKDGLPHKSVRSITQDHDGFIWMGTTDGLCRYDGSQFKIYRHDPEDPHSLVDNRVQNLMLDDDKLWISTFSGLSILDLNTDKIRNYIFRDDRKNDPTNSLKSQLVFPLLKDRQGTRWIGTGDIGFAKYLPEKDSFQFYRYDKNKVVESLRTAAGVDRIFSIVQHQFNDSIIYFGTRAGLLELNKYSEQLNWYGFPQEDKVYERGLNTFRRMHFHDNGLLYVGSWSTSIHVFDPVKKTFTPLPYKKINEGTGVVKSTISGIRKKTEDELWITTGLGVAVYNIQKQEVTLWKENNRKELTDYGINHIDDKGRIWFGTGNGALILDPVVQQYQIHSYEHLNEIGSGFAFYLYQDPVSYDLTVFTGASDQFFKLNWKTKKWSAIPIPDKYLYGNIKSFGTRGISVAPDGKVTVSQAKNIYNYSPESGKLEPMGLNLDFVQGQFRNILWDSKQRLWIDASFDGLLRWDEHAGNLHVFQKELHQEDSLEHAGLYSNLFEDSQGNIWFYRYDGISVYVNQRDTFINHIFTRNPNNTFQTSTRFCEDDQGRVWGITAEYIGYALATEPEKGLVKKINISQYTGKLGFDGLRKDKDGNLWAWSWKCLLKINPQTLEINKYDFEYGADSGDFFSFKVLHSGHFAFGSRNRIYITHPDQLRLNKELPDPYLSGINVLETPLELPYVFHQVRSLSLEHWENFFSFNFAAKSYTLAEKNKFRYRLTPFEQNWIDAKDRRYANYTNVPSGEYIFQLQAANNEGVWNEKLFELPVTIATPWYLSWWFILGAIYFLGLIAYGIYRFRIAQIRKEERLRGEFEKKLASQEMTALRAQMNPHFLFNSLNSIDSFIIKNETHKASEYLNNFARLIRLILQNSRSNQVNLKDELDALELYMQMESLRFNNKFKYEMRIATDVNTEDIDIPPMLMQPYIENAIWHGLMHKRNGQPGKVTLSIEQHNEKLHCIIEDNGIGRERAMEIRASRPDRGKKSVGMKITSDRISMINKLYNTNTSVEIIDLKDEAGQALGTKVELVIPI